MSDLREFYMAPEHGMDIGLYHGWWDDDENAHGCGKRIASGWISLAEAVALCEAHTCQEPKETT